MNPECLTPDPTKSSLLESSVPDIEYKLFPVLRAYRLLVTESRNLTRPEKLKIETTTGMAGGGTLH